MWVANRDNPLNNSAGIVKIVNQNIVLLDQNHDQITQLWSSNSNISKGKNVVAELLDTGNFVLRETGGGEDLSLNPNNYLWQSFDFPTHTLLPGMKLGRDLNTGLDRYLTAWESWQDPSRGTYSLKLNGHGLPELNLYEGRQLVYRSGPWDGSSLEGFEEESWFNFFNTYDQQESSSGSNSNELTYFLSIQSWITSGLSRLILTPRGDFQLFHWDPELEQWSSSFYQPKDNCEFYQRGVCDGSNSRCYRNTTADDCKCPRGFSRNQTDHLSGGCVRDKKLSCVGDIFWPLKNVKFPENYTVVDRNVSLQDCEKRCLNNCKCTAYANANISAVTACLNWFGGLHDMRDIENNRQLFLRLAASEFENKTLLPPPPPPPRGEFYLNGELKKILTVTGVLTAFIIAAFAFFLWKSRAKVREWRKNMNEVQLFQKRKKNLEFPTETLGDRMQELPLFSFEELATATNNFDPTNQLGRGGFGPVFKGTLPNGQEIAVKRLSSASG